MACLSRSVPWVDAEGALLPGSVGYKRDGVQGLKDPEAKRKAIGAGFIEVFNDFAAHFDRKPKYLVQVRNSKAGDHPPVACLAQGTVYL